MRLSEKMKQRGLTPLFHFLEKPSKKMRLSGKNETAGSDPFVSFFGKNQTKKMRLSGKSETAGSDPFVSFFGKNQTKKCD